MCLLDIRETYIGSENETEVILTIFVFKILWARIAAKILVEQVT